MIPSRDGRDALEACPQEDQWPRRAEFPYDVWRQIVEPSHQLGMQDPNSTAGNITVYH